ncbi:sigma-70 family RNA polymerase sigma factor [Microbacterium sp. 1.5R]|uniref:sigma-70 family RNA polymerase sigma factor n=1 Tax=Microbacterium sp. 1.5R TaxID=1916917 RepID=UPI0011A4401C|nr:sigma-70 family RNA polymerase sigma factor [Microbacterium sp. 1.5R]
METSPPLPSSGEDAARGTERRLMAEAAAGGQAALAQVYDLTSAQVFGLILSVVRDRPAAEAVLQETYLHAWQHAADYDSSPDGIAVWLCGIAHRYAIAHLRAAVAAEVDTETAEESYADRLSEAMRSLPPEQSQCIALAYYAGLTQYQIAARTAQTIAAVRSHTRAGLSGLHDHSQRSREAAALARRSTPEPA